MKANSIYNLVLKGNNCFAQLAYWLIAAGLLFFVFSNRGYNASFRLILVTMIVFFSYIASYFINYYLIPNYLFKAKFRMFGYITLGIFVTLLWLILYASILMVVFNAYSESDLMVPQKEDILILVSGTYLIILFAAVIHFIKESYKRLIDKNKLEKEKQLAEIKLKEAHMQLLQGQLHPHFIFNMLNNMYGLINEDTANSRKLIIKLSELLDYMLYECNQEKVKLSDEIHFIENYIELERIRHDEHFPVQWYFPENIGNVKIAPLVLFPFVENAFKHGLKNPGQDTIRMEMQVREEMLVFKIQNSISVHHEKSINKEEQKGIGLKNIRERLGLLYNNKHSLQIQEVENSYRVYLELNLK